MRKEFTLAAVSLLALAACAPNTPLPEPSIATQTAHPALTSDQFEDVIGKINTEVAGADKAKNPALFASRASGPFAKVRPVQYKYDSVFGDSYKLPPASDTISESVVSGSGEYPHVGMMVSGYIKEANYQFLNFYVQTSIRDPWKIWSSVGLLPGATVPAIPAGDGGAEAVAPEDKEGLVVSPKEAFQRYAVLMQGGHDSDIRFGNDANHAVDDPVRSEIVKTLSNTNNAVKDVGDVTFSFTPADDGPLSLRTKDGGAISAGTLTYTTSIRMKDPNAGSIKIGGDIGALANGQKDSTIDVKGTTITHYQVDMVLHIPPANAADKTITVIAANTPLITQVENGN